MTDLGVLTIESDRSEAPPDTAPTARRRLPARLLRPVSLLAVLAAWLVGSATGLVPASKLPSLPEVWSTAGHLAVTGVLLPNLWASLERVLIGTALGVCVGTALGVISGLSRLGEIAFDPLLQALRTLPVLALVPLFIVWLGIGQTSKIDMIAFATLFPMYINLHAGIKAIDPKLLEAAKALKLTRYERIRHVVLPGATGPFLVGLRFATAAAWLVLVVVEQVNASSGIGYLMANAENYLEVNVIVVGLVIYAALGLASDSLVRLLERRFLVWR